MSLKTSIWQDGPDVRMALEGVVDENCQLPDFEEEIPGRMLVDLEMLSMINSLGCRKWVDWMRRVRARAGLILQRCSPPVVNQMNILAGFLPKGVIVESFFAPYLCAECGHNELDLFVRGEHFDDSGITHVAEHRSCPSCSGCMDLDVMPQRYFSFLSTKAKKPAAAG
ncbi:MAG: hypothetical protein AB7G93_09370 [Bdellovibrionales bacterium]